MFLVASDTPRMEGTGVFNIDQAMLAHRPMYMETGEYALVIRLFRVPEQFDMKNV